MKIVVVLSKNLVGQEFSEIIIDEIFGFSLAEKRNVRLIDDEIKEVKVGTGSQFVQDTLTFRKGEGARFKLGEIGEMVLEGETLLFFAHDALNTLGALISLKNGRGEDKIAPTATEITRFIDENFNHGAIIAVLEIITKHKRDKKWAGQLFFMP